MTVNGKPFLDVSTFAEKTWKERVRNATAEEMKWIAEALPLSVLDDEITRRTTYIADHINEYLVHAIAIQKEEKRRLGVF